MEDRVEIEGLYQKYNIEKLYGVEPLQFFTDLGKIGIPQKKPEGMTPLEARVASLVKDYEAKKQSSLK